ncbi:hypothetical protein FQA47_014514 [Oryzias melastigma]|uniref:Uncharacterized protein n=1 Tax=Oryzias melastigma TaxID=30732 RepID=A0A834BZE9_ORYME|nr:hypothetical protein FQA47_014514 [Oryzias melastigma]
MNIKVFRHVSPPPPSEEVSCDGEDGVQTNGTPETFRLITKVQTPSAARSDKDTFRNQDRRVLSVNRSTAKTTPERSSLPKCGRFGPGPIESARVQSKQPKLARVDSSLGESGQVSSSWSKSSPVSSSQLESARVRPSRAKSARAGPNLAQSARVGSSPAESAQVCSNLVESAQVCSSRLVQFFL